MQLPELMCNCTESCRKAENCLYHEDEGWEPSHLSERQTWILMAVDLLLLMNPMCGALMVSQCTETSQTVKTREYQWSGNQRQMCPFSSVSYDEE